MVLFDFPMTIIGIMETSTGTDFISIFTQIAIPCGWRKLVMLNSKGTWTGIYNTRECIMHEWNDLCMKYIHRYEHMITYYIII
jgi:hypothetical protein